MTMISISFNCQYQPVFILTNLFNNFFKPQIDSAVIEYFSSISWAKHKMIINKRHRSVFMSIVCFHDFIIPHSCMKSIKIYTIIHKTLVTLWSLVHIESLLLCSSLMNFLHFHASTDYIFSVGITQYGETTSRSLDPYSPQEG